MDFRFEFLVKRYAYAENFSPIQQLDNFIYSYLKNYNFFLHGNEAGHGNLQRKKLFTMDML